MYRPTLEEIKKMAGSGDLVAITSEIMADLETPVTAFLKISRGGPSFLLESVEGGQKIARYSFIGTEPRQLLITTSGSSDDPLTLLEKELAGRRLVPDPDLPRFCGGAVGYCSYETAGKFEKLPSPEKDTLSLPEAMFMLVDTFLVFDHIAHRISVVSLAALEGDIETAYSEATSRIDELCRRLNSPLELPTSPTPGIKSGTEFVSSISKEAFENSVTEIKEAITSGEAIQVVLSQRLSRATKAKPFDIYRALRSINPSPYMFYLDYGDFQIIGASPEILVRVENGEVVTRPLAGTRRRGATQAEDLALEAELKADPKERAEHIMLVDLGRNDIGRVAKPGTIEVSDLMNVERYSHVMHLVSHVKGRLRDELNSFDALRATFPAGTVSGAPKVRAMQLIAEHEPEKRGPYAGAAGYFSCTGSMDMAIAIRTMITKGGTAYVQAGAGITYDSQPEAEYFETLNKAQALFKAVIQAESSGIQEAK
ncbi:anthranilate synthase component I [Dehalogenimonas etheniformans]|uniref:Anthranilate synthase component 1 n=1 Tax=Dehalogenimonas etheniformans TaxID=1536648 RepID=A0A2P5P811_9CHLR|nr:anthranilate synthase component I [Dehalogenimonas etheniformans]PPD58448.1 anthranilate synthase component I [Dehalogenimonas etheniformans]QNT75868.1 anthranilate synthase component I [Dehalogenimonas etheniformans]